MYGLTPPPVYESSDTFGMKGWFQRIYLHLQSTTKQNATSVSMTVPSSAFAVRVNASGGARTITLPPAAQNEGRQIFIKKIDATANAVTVDGNGAETIDGAATFSLATQYKAVLLYCNGVSWDIIASF